MKSTFCVCLFLFVLTKSCSGWDEECLRKYGSLISEVHKHHATCAVYFIFTRDHRHFEDYTMIHSLTHDFSQQGIRTVISNFDELSDREKFYGQRIVRPLIVVLLQTMDDVVEFHEKTRNTNTEHAVWLMIYFNDVGSSLCKYCANPTGNLLRLRIDTNMMVECCDDRTIREWWSVHDDRTETADYATWTENEGFRLVASSAEYDRRRDVNGVGLRIAVVGESSGDRNVRNIDNTYFGAVLMELKRAMNFTIKTTLPMESFGSYNPTTRNWTGVVGELADGRSDIGVAEFTITSSRMNVINFTLPLMLAQNKLYIKQPDGAGVQWLAYFQAFNCEIWMCIIFMLITSSILLTIINMKQKNVRLMSLFFENYLNVWGLLCHQGLSEFPAETPRKIAFFSILVSAVVVLTAYSASLTSFLTASSATLPFDSLNGFVNDGSYELIVISRSSNWDLFNDSSDAILKKMKKLMKPSKHLPLSFAEGFRQVCEEKVAFYTNELVRKVTSSRIKCKIVAIDTEKSDSLAMALAPGGQYNRIVNYHLQRFHENGILNRLKREFLGVEETTEASHDAVDLWGVAPILSVLSGGIILAIVVLLCEKNYFSGRKNVRTAKKLSQNPKSSKSPTTNKKKPSP